jgi:hypothetical protein
MQTAVTNSVRSVLHFLIVNIPNRNLHWSIIIITTILFKTLKRAKWHGNKRIMYWHTFNWCGLMFCSWLYWHIKERGWQQYRWNNWFAFRWVWSLLGCSHRDVLNSHTEILKTVLCPRCRAKSSFSHTNWFSDFLNVMKITETYPWNSDTELPQMWYVRGRFRKTATQPNHHETL